MDFNITANENALTQPKFELGICGIIHNVFQGDYTTKQFFVEPFPKYNEYEFVSCALADQ